MNKFVTVAKFKNDKDIKGLPKLLHQTESSIRNLSSFDVTTDRYGTLLVPLINDKFPDNIRINIAKKFDDEIWDIGKLESCAKILVHGTIVPKWNSLVKNRAKEQTAKQNTN